MKATGNKIIAELSREKKLIHSLSPLSKASDTGEIYDTLKVLSVGKLAEAEGISVGDYVHMKVIDDAKKAPYFIRQYELEDSYRTQFIIEIYDIFAFTRKSEYDKDVEPSQA